MLKLKLAGIAAILVHHSNKSEDNYRGSTAVAATFEVILGLTKAEDPHADRRHSAGFLIRADKFRGRRDDTMEDQKAFLVDGKWELDGVEERQATRVVQVIRMRRYVNQREIGAALGDQSSHGCAGAQAGRKPRADHREGSRGLRQVGASAS
jgi:hypothetical protein